MRDDLGKGEVGNILPFAFSQIAAAHGHPLWDQTANLHPGIAAPCSAATKVQLILRPRQRKREVLPLVQKGAKAKTQTLQQGTAE